MVLSDQEIEKLVHSQKLITPFKKIGSKAFLMIYTLAKQLEYIRD